MKKRQGKIPRGIRNCNPLNIRTSSVCWVGQCGHDGTFCQFIDLRHGLRAAFKLLHTYLDKYKLDTIERIIKRWAPPNENNTEDYIKRVCNYAGLRPDEVIKVNQEEEKACKLVAAMAFVENGGDYLSKSIIGEAYDLAFHKDE